MVDRIAQYKALFTDTWQRRGVSVVKVLPLCQRQHDLSTIKTTLTAARLKNWCRDLLVQL